MHIRHECPMPDLSFSVAAPLHLHKPNGCKIVASRWSLVGIWLEPSDDCLAGDVMLSVPFQGVDVSFPAKLNATDTPGHYTFAELTVRQRETLGVFYQGVLSGRMVSTNDIITSLDTPVDLVPMGETEQEETQGLAKVKPRLRRIIWNTIFYTAMAVILVVFLGGNIWQRLSHVTLDHGRFVAPITEYVAPDSGYVTRINVAIGDQVKAGDILARIEDPDRESDVDDVRAEVLLAERRLVLAQKRLAQHIAQGIQQEDILITLNEVVGERNLDLRRWKRELRHRKSAANELVVRAKYDGTVYEIHILIGSYVTRGDLVVEVEDKTPRVAVGWVDDSMATTVHIGMKAEVVYVFRGRSKRIIGEVTDIQAGTDTAQPDKFGLVVTIKADDAGIDKTRKWFRHNAPTRIRLKRALFAKWFGGDDAST
jgi:multidrug resistance efflux pump